MNKNSVLYFGVKLSDNVVETPEGYLVFKGAVIARTGFQTYKIKELDAKECEEQGIVGAPDDDVVVYRSAEEVFSKACIASFEGKSVTDRHPGALLDVETDIDFARGHVQNIRQAEELLDDGNEGLLGDIMVKDPHLIAKYKAGLRELSCGYKYHLLKVGDKIYQVDIRGNHVAFVESGRAGSNVRVNDSKPTEGINEMEQNEIAFGEGIKAVAEKTDGKGVAAFFKGLFSLTGKPASVAMDNAPEAKPAADAAAAKDEERKRLHAALDKQLDSRDSATEEQAAQDAADAEALKSIFTSPSAEHSEESGADADREELEEGAQDSEEETEEEEEHEEGAEDEAVESVAAPVIPSGARPQNIAPSATDAAYRAGAAAMAKALKPHIARTTDKRLKGAFDTAARLASTSSFVARSGAGYRTFSRAASTANDSAMDSIKQETARAKAAESAYAEVRKKLRS
jgi:hypothetical protein